MLAEIAQIVWSLPKLQTFKMHSAQLTLNEQKSYVSCTHDTASSRISQSEPSPLVSYVGQVRRYKRIT